MDKTAKQIINEEYNNLAPKLFLKKILKEDNTIIDSLIKVDDYNQNSQIVEENWNWFKQTLIKAINSSIFQHNAKAINSQLFAVKYFTNINFMISESVEDEIKLELKKYFILLKVTDINEFINSFFNLPFEFVSLVIRYVANILSPENKKLLVPSSKEAEESLKLILKKKDEVIQTINNISKGTANNLPIADLLLLLDVKAFFENNPLNVGVLEYLTRTIKYSGEKMENMFGKQKIQLMLQQILILPCYQMHLNSIAKDKNNAYFNNKGTQNSSREVTYDDLVTKYFNPENYVPKTKHPKPIENLEQSPKEEEKQPSKEKGEKINAKQPSEEDLMKQ